ncbi:Uncharacterised protein [Mycobacterium tuberculosis]|nr:Uncharacterised protein [Mycobacterium tuberculosis]CPA87182.1 Uncharacterised protein [Mycobacterium tuberculosis]CPA92421.1 Uncharacterised protein [Mycobacterium tuberculosis]
MDSGPCDSDVEQPTLFLYGLAIGAVCQRM